MLCTVNCSYKLCVVFAEADLVIWRPWQTQTRGFPHALFLPFPWLKIVLVLRILQISTNAVIFHVVSPANCKGVGQKVFAVRLRRGWISWISEEGVMPCDSSPSQHNFPHTWHASPGLSAEAGGKMHMSRAQPTLSWCGESTGRLDRPPAGG